MKYVKKITAMSLAAVTLIASMSMPVMAASRTENFYVELYGGSIVSGGSAKKEVSGDMYTYTKERPGTSIEWVQGVETVNLRGRSASGTTGVTYLGETRYAGGKYLTYYSGQGNVGSYYKLAVQYASENPYEKLDLMCTWRP